MTISLDRLREVLSYAPDTGLFTWRVALRRSVVRGTTAGSPDHDGYTLIRIDGTAYKAHRLAWFYTLGDWPLGPLDHVNGSRSDNRIENLREATIRQNAFNMKARGASSWKGVAWNSKDKRWFAQIRIDGKKVHIGSFRDEREAAEAYLFAALEHHGEFARAA